MKQIISKLTKQRFEKQGLDLNNLVKTDFDYNEIIHLIDLFGDYDVEQIVVDSYDETDSELCTWQDCNYVGNWALTQEELNESFLDNMKLINEAVKQSNININNYFYTYRDKYQMILYFPLRLLENEDLGDYLFVLTNKNRIVTPIITQNNKNLLYQIIEDSIENGTGIIFDENISMMLADGLIKSCGTMANHGIVFTIDNLLWTDSMHNIYKPIIAMSFVETKKDAFVPFYDKRFVVVGSITPDGLSSSDVSMFNSDSRYKTSI